MNKFSPAPIIALWLLLDRPLPALAHWEVGKLQSLRLNLGSALCVVEAAVPRGRAGSGTGIGQTLSYPGLVGASSDARRP